MTIEDIIVKLKDAYVKKRRLYTPHYQLVCKEKEETHFRNAAIACQKLNADPRVWIEAQFRRIGNSKDVFINNIADKNSRNLYLNYIDTSFVPAKKLFEVYQRYVYDRIKAGSTFEDALMDDNLQLAAWYRLIASKEPIPAVRKKYLYAAREDMDEDTRSFLVSLGIDVEGVF